MTLWDKIHVSPPKGLELSRVEAFDVSPILREYYRAIEDAVPRLWQLPNVAPPFGRFFMFGAHGVSRLFGQAISPRQSAGALFISSRVQAGWSVRCRYVWSTRSGRPFWAPAEFIFTVLPDGHMGPLCSVGVLDEGTFAEVLKGSDVSEEDTDAIVGGFSIGVYPFLQAICFLHCKNVSARKIVPSIALRSSRQRSGRPIYSYSVLEISAVTKTLESEGGLGASVSLGRALHVCRGHFKDYRDGLGLFGRFKGIYWWDQALRGSIDHGVHIKDYSISLQPR